MGRILKAWRRGGLATAGRAVTNRVLDAIAERRLGLRTSGLIAIETLVADWRGCHDYFPTAFGELRRVLSDLAPGEADVFLDIGAGKGRALLIAAGFPFARVLGFEVSEILCTAARINLSRCAGHLRCTEVDIIAVDASDATIPHDVTMIYLYNPFRGDRLERLFANIAESLAASPRELSIIYNNPARFTDLEPKLRWLRRVATYVGEYDWIVYRVEPGSIGTP